jgi:hypothetical protein
MSRQRWAYTMGGKPLAEPVLVSEDFQSTCGLTAPVTDLYMDGVRAPDGTDIGSRTKRRNYMRANNLADYDDFKGTFARAAQERQAIQQGTHQREERRQDVARAMSRGRK